MDVDEIVRARRRQHALDALEFEHGRETAVLAQIEEVLTELEGSRIDEATFAHMAPEDVTLVREVLGSDSYEDDLEGEFASESPAEIRREREAERVRLEEVLATSRSRQQALERYVEALDPQRNAPGAGRTSPG